MDVDDDDDVFDAVMIAFASDSDSDDDSDDNLHPNEEDPAEEIVAVPQVGGGSLVGRGGNIERQRAFYSHLLISGVPCLLILLPTSRPFKLPIILFNEILDKVVVRQDNYFRQKSDAAGKFGLSPHQKIATAV
jgi:hypothetical protein